MAYLETLRSAVLNCLAAVVRHPVIATSTFIFLLVATAANLNYTGYCFKENRYWSNSERINIAIKRILDAYHPTVREKRMGADGKVDVALVSPQRRIPYSSPSEFISKNPACCTFANTAQDGYTGSLLDRISGYLSGFVEAKYTVRYLDEGGTERSDIVTPYIAITNCGKPWNG